MKTGSNILAFVANGKGAGLILSVGTTSDDEPSGVSHELHHYLADMEDLIRAMAVATSAASFPDMEKTNGRTASGKEFPEAGVGPVLQGLDAPAFITRKYLHKLPWWAIGAGMTAGFLLGFGIGVVLARRAEAGFSC